MTPLNGNPLQRGETEKLKNCRSEITEFLNADCKYAELWCDPNCRYESMATFYKNVLLKDGIRNVKIHYSKSCGVIAERTDINE